MPRQIYRWFPLVLLFILCAFLWRGLSLRPKEIPSNLISKPMPEVVFQQLNTQTISSNAWRGKVTLLHVWATWCLTCRNEHAFLMQLPKRNGVQLIGFAYHDTPKQVRAWLADYGDPYAQQVLDPSNEAALAFGVYGTPETFIIDADGIIRYKHIGELNHRNWPPIARLLTQLVARAV